MEKGLTITVDDRLIDLINAVEQKLRDDKGSEADWHFPISWCFDEMGLFANGQGTGIEFGCSVGEGRGREWVSVYWREVGKYDNDNWQQHPLDDDYEEPEKQEEN
jgi:hypothetical protein